MSMNRIRRNLHQRRRTHQTALLFESWDLFPHLHTNAHLSPSSFRTLPSVGGECYLWGCLAVPEWVCDHLNRECVCLSPISMPLCVAAVTFISLTLILACSLTVCALFIVLIAIFIISRNTEPHISSLVWDKEQKVGGGRTVSLNREQVASVVRASSGNLRQLCSKSFSPSPLETVRCSGEQDY